jgi:hypothetical protein
VSFVRGREVLAGGEAMPLQNRVLPTGEIVADPGRGLFTGNRGILHDEDRSLGRARWRHPHWIVCALEFKGWRRVPMSPGTWTELFFLDEAVALASGHRPCALCRREAYLRWCAAWAAAGLAGQSADDMDRVLHAARIGPHRRQALYLDDDPPPGAFVALPAPHLVLGDRLLPFTPSGYGAPVARPGGPLTVMTPAPTVAVLRAGYRPVLHPTAQPIR